MSKKPLIPSAEGKLDKFKVEVAKDMALENVMSRKQFGSDKNSGNVGGGMVKRMVKAAEENMKGSKK
ncbi:small, acid-soluble spore protein, alpha/beta type [Clostridium sp. P21]|uniref:Small, acid-soluble spore protein, alpha/beta type n=1 Tax=Clostridium muellerianum TaxID=2716538 RepID=A0A7Y0HQC0_9CLOT|nr:small, acid-soluble spore protein, alpha/beta type [Clostridium muellerianum]NMM63976.1 small, acid-soluble spore protein, alpha/beta type [Clostridium muellerianum]